MRTLVFVAVLTLAVVGCNSDTGSPSGAKPSKTDTSSAKVANELCPIMLNEVEADGGTVEYKGKTIGFCCSGCDEKWAALSDSEKEEKLAAAEKKAKEAK